MTSYHDLIARKQVSFEARGLAKVPALNPTLFAHQEHTVDFLLRQGCGAAFLDTGMGKTRVSLEWGRVIMEATNRPVLMLAPLAVGLQHEREAQAISVDAKAIREPHEMNGKRIYITNYERLAKFDPSHFGAVILDESSILKSFTGATTRALMQAFEETPYRLACTATPAPNDHMELGQHAQFLGVMDSSEMLSRWFISDQTQMGRYRIKKAAARPFWSWVASWARCVSKPSDLGFSDEGFILPELIQHRHIVQADRSVDVGAEKDGQGRLFRIPETSSTSIHKEKRLTIKSRAKLAAEIVFGDWNCPGRQSTPSVAVPSITPALKSASGEKIKADPPKKTPLTCETTTGKTLTSSSEHRKTTTSGTREGENGTQPTTPIATSAGSQQSKDVPSKKGTGDCAPHLASALPSTTLLQNAKDGLAPFVTPHPQTAEGDGLPSITATPPELSEGCFARTATKASASFAMNQIACDALPPTSTNRDWWVIWCDTDYEQDELERLFGDYAVSIRGSQPSEKKEELHAAWLRGERKALICKPSMFGHGLNWQHCARMVFVGLSFSYESYYQAVRRCWRFGQKREVHVHVAMADTERAIWDVVTRKADDHDAMKIEMAGAMKRAVIESKVFQTYQPDVKGTLPAFLKGQ